MYLIYFNYNIYYIKFKNINNILKYKKYYINIYDL